MLQIIFYFGYIGIQLLLASLICYFLYRNQKFYTCQGFCSLLAICINLHDLIRVISAIPGLTHPPILFPIAEDILSFSAVLLAFKNAYLLLFWGSFALHLKRLRAHHYKYLRLR